MATSTTTSTSAAPNPAAPARAATGMRKKIGPLPMWGWFAIAGGGVILWAMVKRKGTTSAAASSTDTTGTSASDVPQTVNQTYTTVTAPNVQDDDDTQPVIIRTRGPHPPPNHRPPHPKQHHPRPGPDVDPIFNGKYTVRKGDTLDSVAKKFHITRDDLAHANGYGTGAGLRTGETLRVPSPAPGGHPNPAP